LARLDASLKNIRNDLTERVMLEEDAVEKQKRGTKSSRISLRKTSEDAKKESLKPTPLAELTAEDFIGNVHKLITYLSNVINTKQILTINTEKTDLAFIQIKVLLQEQVQRRNNMHEGAGLCEISEGSCLLLFADASAINNDTFSSYGLPSTQKPKFSELLASATRDVRQYTSETVV
jgi:hypothetical protein